ncbi:hypothetical protein FRC18_008546 [Serendipita sp. 400]|nr:hypothetical protein FRC18_008546 [Serendipita sp. 400]
MMIQVWDADTGSALGEPLQGHMGCIHSVAYSPDSRHIASGSYDNTIRIWDIEAGVVVGEPLRGHTDSILSITYSPDGRYITSGSSDQTIRIWDTETGDPVVEPLRGHRDFVSSVTYSPDGRYIVSGGHDQTIRVWEPATLGSSTTIDLSIDSNGWIHHPKGGLWLWVPEFCRKGLVCPAILTIPTNGSDRAIHVDLSSFHFGPFWTEIDATARQ